MNSAAPVYLRKSAYIYKIYGSLFLFAVTMSLVVKPMFNEHADIFDWLIGLPGYAILLMAPVGLYYSWKSLRRKEGLAKTRFLYFAGHLLFCLLVIGMIAAIASDLSKIL